MTYDSRQVFSLLTFDCSLSFYFAVLIVLSLVDMLLKWNSMNKDVFLQSDCC